MIVFGGTLNLTQSINQSINNHSCNNYKQKFIGRATWANSTALMSVCIEWPGRNDDHIGILSIFD